MVMGNDKIDFIITWVNGEDPNWLKERAKFENRKNGDYSINRFRDWGLLKYWFRGVEKFAPWVNKIHFVTWGHIPEWLNQNNPKLNIVKHSDFIPHEYLPTFNSNAIELNLHRINGLSEKFVYFNDDVFIIKPVKSGFFFINDIPCDSAVLTAVQPTKRIIDHVIFNNMKVINENFGKSKSFEKYISYKYGIYNLKSLFMLPFRKYSAFQDFHCHLNLKKETLENLWGKEFEVLDECCRNKFRTRNDISIWLARYWQLASGQFIASRINDGYYEIDDVKIIDAISKQRDFIICLNDVVSDENILELKSTIVESFEVILPDFSAFEVNEDYL